MPTYEYECNECGKHFDLFQPITEDPKKECIFCKGPVKRLIGTGAGIIFKGSGFYATDNRKDSYKKAEKKDRETTTKVKDSKDTKPTKSKPQ